METNEIPRHVAETIAETVMVAVMKAWSDPDVRAKYEQWRTQNGETDIEGRS